MKVKPAVGIEVPPKLMVGLDLEQAAARLVRLVAEVPSVVLVGVVPLVPQPSSVVIHCYMCRETREPKQVPEKRWVLLLKPIE